MEIGYLFLWFAVATATALTANKRGRDGLGWFMLGFFFSIFALVVVLVLPPLKTDSKTGEKN